MTIHANITAYRGYIVFDLLAEKSVEGECHIDNPGVIGQVIMDTQKHLGVSPEALELLKRVQRGRDSIGDVDWFKTGDSHAFGWLGGPKKIMTPEDGEASRQYVIGPSVTIANDVPEGAREAIDEALG